MCLILTCFAAVIASILWYFKDEKNLYKLGTLALMYWGACLMWFVDCFFALMQEEAFLDLLKSNFKVNHTLRFKIHSSLSFQPKIAHKSENARMRLKYNSPNPTRLIELVLYKNPPIALYIQIRLKLPLSAIFLQGQIL